MISFWSPAVTSFGIRHWLERDVPGLLGAFEIRHYETLAADGEVTRGAHIFSGLDQLGPAGLAAVTALYQAVGERCPGDPRLNNPHGAVGRYELLARCYAAGVNDHRAWRAGTSLSEARYPVFLREDAGHGGALTGLLGSAREVSRALRALRVRGFPLAALLVVEFCDLSEANGEFNTAAVCRVGDRIVPSHWIRGRDWMLKWEYRDRGRQALQDYYDFATGSRYEAWQRRAFELGGIEYGRLDFGVQGDTLRVWEINLSPTLGGGPGPPAPPEPPQEPELERLFQHAGEAYNARLRDAFVALDPARRQDRVRVRLDPHLPPAMHAEQRRRRRHAAGLGVLRKLYHLPLIGRPLRGACDLLWPRL